MTFRLLKVEHGLIDSLARWWRLRWEDGDVATFLERDLYEASKQDPSYQSTRYFVGSPQPRVYPWIEAIDELWRASFERKQK
jgi:hypothetical protein